MNNILISETVNRLRYIANTPNVANRPIDPMLVMEVNGGLNEIIVGISQDDSLLSQKLSVAAGRLFVTNGIGLAFVNLVALGEAIFALDYLEGWDKGDDDSHEEGFMWSCVHPAIVRSSKELYADGHYAQAAVDAFIEFNDQAKIRYRETHPGFTAVPDGRDLMNKLFAPGNPALKAPCTVQGSEQDCQEGLHFMAAGAMAALRNPKSHSNNEVLTAEEAMRRLMFASMLMYRLNESMPS